MLFTKLMASEATLGGFLARERRKTDDFGGIGRFSVFLAGTVAGLAALELHPFVLVQLSLPVRALIVTFGLLLVAGLTGFSPHVLRWVDSLMALGQLFALLGVAAGLAVLRIGGGTCAVAMLLGTSNREPNQSHNKDQ